MSTPVPRNGILSGMVATWGTALVVVPLAIFSTSFRAHFAAPLSSGLYWSFVASVVAMALHKAESYWAGEFDQCPVYLTTSGTTWGHNPRQALFVGFVGTFIGMMVLLSLVFAGPPWHLVLITVWLGQGLHELHHTAKSVARKHLYPGSVTSVVFVAVVAGAIYPRWYELVVGEVGPVFYLYYAAAPLLWVGFYLEDRGWIARAPRSVWSRSQGLVTS